MARCKLAFFHDSRRRPFDNFGFVTLEFFSSGNFHIAPNVDLDLARLQHLLGGARMRFTRWGVWTVRGFFAATKTIFDRGCDLPRFFAWDCHWILC
jgi:hypothetical protein